MIFLPDVNVWVALAVGGHIHNIAASAWLNTVQDDVVFCRITQMGLLRLLTNPKAMGTDVLDARRAWAMFDAFLQDSRISTFGEPSGLSTGWRALTRNQTHGSNWWTDTYLAAFSASGGFTLVTFNTQLAARKNVSTLLLRR